MLCIRNVHTAINLRLENQRILYAAQCLKITQKSLISQHCKDYVYSVLVCNWYIKSKLPLTQSKSLNETLLLIFNHCATQQKSLRGSGSERSSVLLSNYPLIKVSIPLSSFWSCL